MQKAIGFLKQNRTWLVILLFTVVGLTLYANSFHNQMFWDDNDGIINNAFIKDWHFFPKYFLENLIAGSGLVSNYWRPVLLIIFSVEWHLWHGHVLGWHLVNTLAHIFAAVLLFLVLKRFFRNFWLAFISSLFFLIHPLQTEAVTYVSGLADPLSAVFTLLGVWFYLNFKDEGGSKANSWNYILALIMYPLAVMTKDSAVVMPALIALFNFFYEPASGSFRQKVISTIRHTYPFFLTTAVYALLRATTLNFQNTFNLYNEQNLYTSNFFVRLFTFFKVLATYFGLLLWPNHLHMERTVTLARSLLSWPVLLGILILLLLLAVVRSYKKYPIISFGILWFIAMFFPHSNLLVPTAGLIYEHWLYLPMAGLWLALFYIIQINLPRLGRAAVLTGISALVVCVTFFSAKTISRNRDWHDPITFYNQTLAYSPDSYRIINNLGMAYDDAHEYAKAKKMYERAISLNPSVQVAYHNLGNTYKELGDTELAVRNFETAIRLDPTFSYSYNALTQLYLSQKNYGKARGVQESYLPHSPSPLDTLSLLVQIALEENNKKAALDYLNQARTLAPDNQSIRDAIRQLTTD